MPEKLIAFICGDPYTRDGQPTSNTGTVLVAFGEVLPDEFDSQANDLGDWMIYEFTEPGYRGLLVWEGECDNAWSRHHGHDWEPSFTGAWRLPTDEECLLLRSIPAEVKTYD